MRIYVHDYAGHPFQVQLSRELARRGHEVRHGYSSTNLTPQGALAKQDGDPETFEPDPIALDRPVDKKALSFRGLVRRRQSERAYGAALIEHVRRFSPDVVLAANTPIDALVPLQAWATREGVRVVNWLQDVLSVGTDRVLRNKLPVVGGVIGRAYLARERRLLLAADAVVAITEGFRPLLREWGVPNRNIHVVENWAPLDELPRCPKANPWSQSLGLEDKRVALYAGTLGMKHNPGLLLALAERLQRDPEARVVVVSEGAGADWLRAQSPPSNLILLPFQAFEDLPDVHGTADVLVAILEPDAGVYSVPSKVLSYLCAARPVLLAVPPENLVAQIVQREEAGVVVPPTAPSAFGIEGERLLADAALRERMAARARSYAENTFDIEAIGERFETILAA
ncbi:MAG: glycosyltransferase family 4 protein [Bacteroidota bacterium]